MKTFALTLAYLICGSIAQAYIPPTRMIFERTADNSGSGSYTIEQEVQFPNGTDLLSLKEVWEVDRDRGFKVTVSGLRDLKDKIRFQFIYAGGQKWSLSASGKRQSGAIPAEFTERLFHWRDLATAAHQMTSLGFVPSSLFQKKSLPKKSEEIRHTPEEGVRLARTGGTVAWAFGRASSPTSDRREPGIWIEQDQFRILKVRFPSLAEMSAEQYQAYARGLQLPKTRIIQWSDNIATIRLLGVNGKGPQTISLQSLELSSRTEGLMGQPAQQAIEEFYSRFR